MRVRTFCAALSAFALATTTLAGNALADDISNRLDASVDAVAEAMPLNVGGADGTTELYLIETNGDGKNGCNLTGSTTLGLSVQSSDTSVATVSPSSVTFTSCEDTKVLTVTPVAQGSATISVSQTSNTTLGTFDLAPATFTVNVVAPAPSNTAPSVLVTGVTGGATYDKGAVPEASCQVTDSEDGNHSFPATLIAVTGPYASDDIGSQTASCTYTDEGGVTAEASATYSIVDPSGPEISYTLAPASPDGANGWYRSDVSLTWNVDDAQSPNSVSKTGCVDQAITSDQDVESYTCSATSAGGEAGPESVSIKRDGTDPNAPTASLDPAPNAAGWNNTDVVVHFTATGDNGPSGVDDCTADVPVNTETAGQTVSGTCTDNAGNISAATEVTVKVDKTDPTIGHTLTPSTGPNTNGWYNSDVEVDFTCADVGGSGIDSCSGDTTLGEGADQSATGTATDLAGNTATDAASGINIDKTDPTVSLVGGPGASYIFGDDPDAPTCDASDQAGLSGLASCVVSGGGTSVGPHSYTATATDNAGNVATATLDYTVLAWTTKGYYSPVDMGGVWNTVKGGSTVPLKFELFAGPTELTSTSAVASFKTAKVNCSSGTGTEDALELVTTGGTSLRYDSTGGQFIQNWQTPTGAGTCYSATMTALDGSTISALFKIK